MTDIVLHYNVERHVELLKNYVSLKILNMKSI